MFLRCAFSACLIVSVAALKIEQQNNDADSGWNEEPPECKSDISHLDYRCWEKEPSAPHPSKIVWMYWDDPKTSPSCVEPSVKSWRLNNPNYSVRLLDDEAIESYLPFRAISRQLTVAIGPAGLSDLLRLFLLAKHGGIWTDACSFNWKPLDDFQNQWDSYAGYFLPPLKGVAPDRQITQWFMASQARDETMMKLLRYSKEYLFKHRDEPLTEMEKVSFHRGDHFDITSFVPRELIGENITDYNLVDFLEKRKLWPYFWVPYLFNQVIHDDARLQTAFDKMADQPRNYICWKSYKTGCMMTKIDRRDNNGWRAQFEERRRLGIDPWMEAVELVSLMD